VTIPSQNPNARNKLNQSTTQEQVQQFPYHFPVSDFRGEKAKMSIQQFPYHLPEK
jgi:hypothetical protein